GPGRRGDPRPCRTTCGCSSMHPGRTAQHAPTAPAHKAGWRRRGTSTPPRRRCPCALSPAARIPLKAVMLKLEVLNTAFKGKQFKYKPGLKIGAGPDCQIRAQSDDMQDVHVRFYDDGDRHMVEVATDKARLYVNGKDVMRSELR